MEVGSIESAATPGQVCAATHVPVIAESVAGGAAIVDHGTHLLTLLRNTCAEKVLPDVVLVVREGSAEGEVARYAPTPVSLFRLGCSTAALSVVARREMFSAPTPLLSC